MDEAQQLALCWLAIVLATAACASGRKAQGKVANVQGLANSWRAAPRARPAPSDPGSMSRGAGRSACCSGPPAPTRCPQTQRCRSGCGEGVAGGRGSSGDGQASKEQAARGTDNDPAPSRTQTCFIMPRPTHTIHPPTPEADRRDPRLLGPRQLLGGREEHPLAQRVLLQAPHIGAGVALVRRDHVAPVPLPHLRGSEVCGTH